MSLHLRPTYVTASPRENRKFRVNFRNCRISQQPLIVRCWFWSQIDHNINVNRAYFSTLGSKINPRHILTHGICRDNKISCCATMRKTREPLKLNLRQVRIRIFLHQRTPPNHAIQSGGKKAEVFLNKVKIKLFVVKKS